MRYLIALAALLGLLGGLRLAYDHQIRSAFDAGASSVQAKWDKEKSDVATAIQSDKATGQALGAVSVRHYQQRRDDRANGIAAIRTTLAQHWFAGPADAGCDLTADELRLWNAAGGIGEAELPARADAEVRDAPAAVGEAEQAGGD